MFRYCLKRIIMVIPVILGVLCIVFILQAVTPGDAVDQLLPADATAEQKEAKREELGLNDPLVVQFGRYAFNFFTSGDLGTNYKTEQSVSVEISRRFPYTIVLAIGSVLIAVLFGIPLGVLAATHQYSWGDSGIQVGSMIFVSMPSFWLALMCISLFSVKLKLLPSSGIQNPLGWIMPMCVLGLANMSTICRITRSSMLEVIRQDYIRTARAKGQNEVTITIYHALRNALIPILACIGNQLGSALGGALIIENIFGIPGIGKYVTEAISARNFPAVQGGVIILAITYTVVNLVVDLSYTFVDPRLKTEFSSGGRKRKSAKMAVAGGN